MEDVTRASGSCPRCGAAMAPDAVEGLCAACLLAAGTETLTQSAMDDAPTVSSAGSGAAAHGSDAPQRTGTAWGPYRIGRLLGRGGMGEVYEAEHTGTGRRLALKVLRSRLQNADDRARFLREGQLAASVSHPHTVYIFGSEEISGTPVISMELLPGGTLKDRVAAHGALSPTEAVAAVLDIVGGLDAAQAAGILHRDIKPSNCFVDSDGAVKVGDFGLSIATLARDVHHDLETGAFQGTPQFAPPEQLRGEPLDVRADIYAVGATLYYLLTGQPPFDATDLRGLFARVTTEAPRSPRTIRPEIPPGLAAVVMQCLAKTPADRPATYAALADALRPFSSRDDAPARLGVRLVAGAIDGFIVSLPLAAGMAWLENPFTTSPTSAINATSWTWLVSFAYYTFLEGGWSASLGKRIFGLRVTLPDGARATWRHIVVRTPIFFIPSLVVALLVLISNSTGVTDALGVNVVTTIRSIVSFALLGILFCTARRHNGWAALHDLASGTRVVSRSTAGARLRSPVPAPMVADAVSTGARYGPFTVVSDAGDTASGRLIVGFDPVLRRQVWIHVVAPHTPPIDAGRRDVGRIGRLHWLTGRRSADENWDAFEAPGGAPLLVRQASPSAWPTVKFWLLDLANELAAARRDGSVPALGLDRIWIRSDGRLVLLDFPFPSARSIAPQTQGSADFTPVGLLSAVATFALPAAPNVRLEPQMIPLSARALLDRWSSAAPPSLDEARTALVSAAASPDYVSSRRRAISIVLTAAPVLILIVAVLALVPVLVSFLFSPQAQLMQWLDLLNQPNQPAGSRLADPQVRDAVERYVAGRFASELHDQTSWSTLVMRQRQFAEWRRVAEDLVERHPSVSPTELERVSAIIAPEIERMERRRRGEAQQGPLAFLNGVAVMISALSVLWLALALVASIVSSLVVPGGVVTRFMGLAVVTRDGVEVGRWQSLVRTLVAWLPTITWLGYLAASPKIQGWVPAPPAPLLTTTLALGVIAACAFWTIARPARGLHDLLMRTWVVAR